MRWVLRKFLIDVAYRGLSRATVRDAVHDLRVRYGWSS